MIPSTFSKCQDQAQLKYVMSCLSSADVPDLDVEAFQHMLVTARSVSVSRPGNLVKFAENHDSSQGKNWAVCHLMLKLLGGQSNGTFLEVYFRLWFWFPMQTILLFWEPWGFHIFVLSWGFCSEFYLCRSRNIHHIISNGLHIQVCTYRFAHTMLTYTYNKH